MLLKFAMAYATPLQEYINSTFFSHHRDTQAKADDRCCLSRAGSLGEHDDLYRFPCRRGVGRLHRHGPGDGGTASWRSFCKVSLDEQRQAADSWRVAQTCTAATHGRLARTLLVALSGAKRIPARSVHGVHDGFSSRLPLAAARHVRSHVVAVLRLRWPKPSQKHRRQGNRW